MVKQAGTTSQFDDLILDPGKAEGGGSLNQLNQGYEASEGIIDMNQPTKEELAAMSTPKGKPAEKPAAKKEEDEDLETFDNINSQVNLLETKEDKKDEAKDKKEGEGEKPKDELPDGTKTPEEESEKGKEGEKIEGKALALFKDGKKYEVPMDATIKVKVDGKGEKVTIAELRDAYSGQKAWDKKFQELDAEKSRTSAKEQELTKVQAVIKSTLGEVSAGVKEALAGNKNPMEAVNKIIDLLQLDSYDFNKALFDSLSEELVALDQMDEYERKAYWLEKKNNHLQQRHSSFEEKMKESKTQADRLAHIDRIREAHGVSEEDFVSAYTQLSQMGKTVNPEQVVTYAANLPFVTQAEELLTPYEDQLSDSEFEDMMARVAHTMKINRGVTKEDMATWLAENYKVEELINQANNKADKIGAGKESSSSKPSAVRQQDLYSQAAYESFEDFGN